MVVSDMALAQRGEPVVIPLWPNGAPNDNHLTGEEGHPDPRSSAMRQQSIAKSIPLVGCCLRYDVGVQLHKRFGAEPIGIPLLGHCLGIFAQVVV